MKVVVRDKCYYCWVSLLLQKSVLLLQDYTTKTKLLQQCGPFQTIINFYCIVAFEMKKLTWLRLLSSAISWLINHLTATLESGIYLPLRLLIFGIFSRVYGFIMDLKDLNFTT